MVWTIEQDLGWYKKIKSHAPSNVILKHAPIVDEDPQLDEIREFLSETQSSKFDVIVVDGNRRYEATKIALEWLSSDGAIILDDAAGHGFYDLTKALELRRIDFFGFAPNVNRPRCTSLLYRDDCFLLDPKIKIPYLVY